MNTHSRSHMNVHIHIKTCQYHIKIYDEKNRESWTSGYLAKRLPFGKWSSEEDWSPFTVGISIQAKMVENVGSIFIRWPSAFLRHRTPLWRPDCHLRTLTLGYMVSGTVHGGYFQSDSIWFGMTLYGFYMIFICLSYDLCACYMIYMIKKLVIWRFEKMHFYHRF